MTGASLPYYELRLYKCVSGRIPDHHHRMTHHVPALFAANGVSQPLILWSGYSGPKAPLYAYLLRWDDLDQRTAAFRRFYADPAWVKYRDESNAGRQMIDRIDVYILRPLDTTSDFSLVEAHADRLHEIRLQQVLSRDAEAATNAWRVRDLPRLTEAGGRSLGSFAMWYGPNLPQLVSLLTWPDLASRQAALTCLDRLDSLDGVRACERKRFGRPLYDRCESHLVQRQV